MKGLSEVLSPETRRPRTSLDIARIREDFPILGQKVNGRPLVYLDNAATSQKPRQVIEAISHFYSEDYSNIHRGVHTLSQRSTQSYEAVRTKVQKLIHAAEDREIIFVRGTTEGNNLVAFGYLRPRLQAGDEIVISGMEHHSNIVPWQMLCEDRGALLRVIPVNETGELDMKEYEKLL